MIIIMVGILIGAVAGLIGALLGVGGGIVMVPAFMKALNMPYDRAVATSLAVIIVTAIVATTNYAKAGLIDWKVFGLAALGTVLAAWFGAELMQSMRSIVLTRIFAIFMIIMGIKLLLEKAPAS